MRRRTVSACVAVELAALSALALLGDLVDHLPAFLLLFLLASTAFLAAYAAGARVELTLRYVVLTALLLRAPLLFTTPTLSGDVWRYLHDGRAQIAGANPYRYPPAAAATVGYRGAEFARINHPELHTIYPPAAQVAFAAAAALGATLWSWKFLLLGFDLAVLFLLLALTRTRASPHAAALYAWHPLVIVEIAGSAHMDLVAIAPLLAGLLLLQRGYSTLGGGALALAIGAKFLPAAYLPCLRPRNTLAFASALAAALFVLYAGYGAFSGVRVFGSLGNFADQWYSNGSLFLLTDRWLDDRAARWVHAALLAATIVIASRFATRERALLGITFAALLLSPIVHPWYLVWLVPLLVLQPRFDWLAAAALTWTLSVPLAYTAAAGFRASGVWQIAPWAHWLEYLLLLLALTPLLSRTRLYSARSGTSPAG